MMDPSVHPKEEAGEEQCVQEDAEITSILADEEEPLMVSQPSAAATPERQSRWRIWVATHRKLVLLGVICMAMLLFVIAVLGTMALSSAPRGIKHTKHAKHTSPIHKPIAKSKLLPTKVASPSSGATGATVPPSPPRKVVVIDDVPHTSPFDFPDPAAVADEKRLRSATSIASVLADAYSGFVRVDKASNAHMFFTLSEARDHNRSAPVIVWLMGGPGVPSSFSMYSGLGPLTAMNGKNPHSLNDHAAMLLLDQPVGTGLSYSDKLVSEDHANVEHLAHAIPTIMERYNKRKCKLFIAGVSYGAKIAALLADALPSTLQLSGVALMSGWVDPISVIRSYSFHYHARGLIDAKTSIKVANLEREAVQLVLNGMCGAIRYVDDDGKILRMIMNASAISNVYKLTQSFMLVQDYFKPLQAAVDTFNQNAHALPVGGRGYETSFNPEVYKALQCAITKSAVVAVDNILKRGVRVRVLFGDEDGMIPLLSSIGWIRGLDSPAAKELRCACDHPPCNADCQGVHQRPWMLGKRVVGYIRQDAAGQLSEVTVLGAGHMIDMDRPEALKALLEQFMSI